MNHSTASARPSRPASPVRRMGFRALAALTVAAAVPLLFAGTAGAATAKAGGVCTKAGAKSGALVCSRKAGKLVWAKATTATTAATATTKAATATTAGAAASTTGIDGTWKAVTGSEAGYRVKEVLMGQDSEAVGRTTGVTGSLTIEGTKATAADVTVDVTKLKSPESMRDGQVQGRILSTSQFPTATMKLVSPVDFGKVPADKEQLTVKAKVDLTLRGTKKTVDVDLQARRNGANIEVLGSIPVKFSEWNIPNPTSPLAKVGDDGTIEFLIVFGR